MSIDIENMRTNSTHKQKFGDDIESLPTDEKYDKTPDDLNLINTLFMPKKNNSYGLSKEIQSVIFACFVFALLSSPTINKQLRKLSSNTIVINGSIVVIVVGSTYLFQKLL